MLSDYEQARAERIAANNAKMASLGIAQAAQQLHAVTNAARPPRPINPPPRKKRKMYEIEVQVRRSGRLQGEQPEYNEENLFARQLGIESLDLLAPRRRRRVGMDPTALGAIRERRVREVDGEDAEIPRGPFDSGLGVRIQGGRVYDSKYGVTCHWCRQKTLEEHVTCTCPDCGAGRRLAISFCKLCLKNRHGEDILQAEASNRWVCPRCRGACGQGCASCCNCGPCRKALGLAPTHQIIKQARAAGFNNVHDYLVHQHTGESADEIAARKGVAPWGAWPDVPFDAEAAAEAATAGSDDEEAESESKTAEPAAAALAVQLEQRQQGTVPASVGTALLLFGALRWHLLASRFCAAAKELAPKQAAAAPARGGAYAAKASTGATKPKPAAAKPKAAPRRSGRSQVPAQGPTRLATKVTAFFQAAVPDSAKKQGAKQAAEAPRTRSRLGMRACK